MAQHYDKSSDSNKKTISVEEGLSLIPSMQNKVSKTSHKKENLLKTD